ncbi:MAG: DUF883 domain-containing protein [Rhodoferax sp.]|nr:DUF883 domain-containing protein [Rhodoferax sp.]
MNDASTAYKDKLMGDLKVVIADAEELLRMTTSQAGEGADDLRSRVQSRIGQMKNDLAHMQTAALARAKAMGQATDEFVHTNPWMSVGAAAGVGVLIGWLASRR